MTEKVDVLSATTQLGTFYVVNIGLIEFKGCMNSTRTTLLLNHEQGFEDKTIDSAMIVENQCSGLVGREWKIYQQPLSWPNTQEVAPLFHTKSSNIFSSSCRIGSLIRRMDSLRLKLLRLVPLKVTLSQQSRACFLRFKIGKHHIVLHQ